MTVVACVLLDYVHQHLTQGVTVGADSAKIIGVGDEAYRELHIGLPGLPHVANHSRARALLEVNVRPVLSVRLERVAHPDQGVASH